MSQAVVDRLHAQFAERVLETSETFGDHEVVIGLKDWTDVAQFLLDDADLKMFATHLKTDFGLEKIELLRSP